MSLEISSIYEYLEQNSKNPDAVALFTPGKSPTSFFQLHALAQQVAKDLASIGIARSPVVGLAIESRDVLAAALLAVGSCATVVPISMVELETMRAERLLRFHLDAVLIDTDDQEPTARLLSLNVPLVKVVPEPGFAGLFHLETGSSKEALAVEYSRWEDTFVLLETSGTTGDPKVAPITHRSILTTGRRSVMSLDVSAEDRILMVRPLHHSGGVHELVRGLVNQIPVVIAEFSPETLVDLVLEFGVTWFALVPSMHRAVLPHVIERRSELRRSRLRFVRSDSAPLTVELKKEVEEAWNAPVVEGYGATESGTLAINNWNGKQGSVGEVPPGIVSIRDTKGNEMPVGQPGEVCSTGPTVFPGYLDDPDGNAGVFHGEWYRTGDLGYLDEDGYLFLTGRIKEAINRGGETIAPGELDAVISSSPLVEEAAAFGVPHETLGEEVFVAVKLRAGVDSDESLLRSEFAQLFPFSKAPKRVFIVDQFQLNRFGKIDRDALRKCHGPMDHGSVGDN